MPSSRKFVPFLENVVSHAVVATILTISLERFRVACHSQSHTGPTSRFIVVTFVLIWIISITSAVPVLFITEYRKRMLLDGTPVSVCITPILSTWHKVYMVLITSLFFVVPFLFIVLLYMRVCFALVCQFRKEERRLELYPSEVVRLKRQMIQIIVTVVLVFFVCHSPYRALAMWTMFEEDAVLRNIDPNTFLSVFYLARILMYSNHAINPIVYNFVAKKFRRALLWVCCDRRRKRSGSRVKYETPQHDAQCDHDCQTHVIRRSSRHMVAMGVPNVNVDEVFEHANRSHRNNFMVLYENLLV
ncbi:orexin receptor type 2-like [Gigantopelta aegis]|uniref:orexin receptor type 2-like n=1 Tax=Gigantopelta aegis TaxID=1735272 RepID=UPI001B887F26|nr:orexin receptor type 2-like [Gigantopelta aegis]